MLLSSINFAQYPDDPAFLITATLMHKMYIQLNLYNLGGPNFVYTLLDSELAQNIMIQVSMSLSRVAELFIPRVLQFTYAFFDFSCMKRK